jgi:hypothetical protein
MLAPDLPDDVRLIIKKAMARDRGARYQRGLHFAEDLQRALDGRPLQDEPTGAQTKSLWGKIKGIFGQE